LAIFPWASFRKNKAAIKVHTQLDLRGPLPVLVHVTDGKVHDVNWLDAILFEPACFYLLDRGYVDFGRLWRIEQADAYFITRAKSNLQFYRCHSQPPQGEGVIADQVIRLTGVRSKREYPEPMRRVVYRDPETGKLLVFLTNNFDLPALTIALLYKARWKIELFFKWLKGNVRIKAFFGREPNAVKIQIWCALAVYSTLLIIKRRLGLTASLHSILAVLSVSIFEQVDIHELFTEIGLANPLAEDPNQLVINY
jgi:IS4 transposase